MAFTRKDFHRLLNEKILLFDGAMGTSIQQFALTADDFDRFGKGDPDVSLEGCNEVLVVSRPDVIEQVHASYFEAGADVVETNTFGSTDIVLAEYSIPTEAYRLNVEAAKLAKRVAAHFSKEKPRFVAGSIGPTTKLPSLGHITYTALKQSYLPQVEGLIDGGVDIFLVETCQDLLQTKAALAAIDQVKRQKKVDLPVMAQVTIEAIGTMLVGMDIAAVIAALEPFDIDVIGMNCATGPQEMAHHILQLGQASQFYLSCLPNAGIPENIGGKAHYKLTPDELAKNLKHFVIDHGVNIVGGCCGTTPEHIKALSNTLGGLSPTKRTPSNPNQLTSLYSTAPFRVDPAPVLIGERTNANGSKKFRDLLAEDDYDALVDIAKSQVDLGAHVLDVCTAYVGRDEVKDMTETIQRFNAQLDVPLMIDSTEVPVIEVALQQIAGKAIVNSINLEDGEARAREILQLCKTYGAAVVALTINEDGMAKTAGKKLEIAERIYRLAVDDYGIRPEDIVFDTLTFTLGSGDEEFRKAGLETIEGIRKIKTKFPKVSTVLGISNISFGLKPAARHVINSMFLHEAVEAGLDMAIFNTQHLVPLHKIAEDERTLCLRLINDDRVFDANGEASSDPLTELMAFYENQDGSAGYSKVETQLPTDLTERLKYRIINGAKTGLRDDLLLALDDHTALEIINTILLDGMKTVGELFGKGEMQLPFVLQSAEVMKTAVAILEPYMERIAGQQTRGKIVLATVKGDVHDIGKNLVDIILTNNGYTVYNLGIKQSIEAILEKTKETQADAIGMSGLLVKSTAIMKENLMTMTEQNLGVPVLLGGAALTPRFVAEDCQNVYPNSVVLYSQDAFSGLRHMEAIMAGEYSNGPSNKVVTTAPSGSSGSSVAAEDDAPYQAVGEIQRDTQTSSAASVALLTKPKVAVQADNPIPKPPFWGVRVLEDVPIADIYPYLNSQALIAGQWQVKRGSRTPQEQEALLQEKIYPVLDKLKAEALTENYLHPRVIYGYYPCQADGNTLVLYEEDQKTERVRIPFPRGGALNLCISDYFRKKESGEMDVVALQIVTMGREATKKSQELFNSGNYSDYLYFHGFSVEMTEALAEYWHKTIRTELGIDGKDETEMRKLFAQGYQGSRYSFGYPACPRLEDQVYLMDLLKPERIGIELTEEFMLEPEQSTSAIILHHPEARYFDVR